MYRVSSYETNLAVVPNRRSIIVHKAPVSVPYHKSVSP